MYKSQLTIFTLITKILPAPVVATQEAESLVGSSVNARSETWTDNGVSIPSAFFLSNMLLRPIEHLVHWFGPDALHQIVLGLIVGLIVAFITWAGPALFIFLFKHWLARRKPVNATAVPDGAGVVVAIAGRCNVQIGGSGTLKVINQWWI
jgi:hypothetical protein